MNIILFEDKQSQCLYPLGLFRPLYDLRVGSWTFRNIVEQLGQPVVTITRGHFGENTAETAPIPVPGNEPALFLNASIEPDIAIIPKLNDLIKSGEPFLSTSGNRVAAALVPPGRKLPESADTASLWCSLLELNLPLQDDESFRTIDWPHEAVDAHLRLFPRNLKALIARGTYTERQPGLFVGKNVQIAPSVVVDTAKGPVVLEDGVEILHFTFLRGPLHIGKKTRVIEHSSLKDSTAVGSNCKIGGEVEASVICSYSNKQHHGFLGHSRVGRWVNLGAGTSNSDLKNTYGIVNVDYNGKRMSTNMQFLGSVVGDFAKTAVNTTIYTGKMIGVCSMVYGVVTTNVPSYSNYARSFGQVTEVRIDQIEKTQKRMFERRGVAQNAHDIMLINRVFDLTKHERTMSEEQINF